MRYFSMAMIFALTASCGGEPDGNKPPTVSKPDPLTLEALDQVKWVSVDQGQTFMITLETKMCVEWAPWDPTTNTSECARYENGESRFHFWFYNSVVDPADYSSPLDFFAVGKFHIKGTNDICLTDINSFDYPLPAGVTIEDGESFCAPGVIANDKLTVTIKRQDGARTLDFSAYPLY